MQVDEKIAQSLRSAAIYVEKTTSALGKGDADLFDDSLWHGTEELEYALFLFSLRVQQETDTSKWKPRTENTKTEAGPLLESVRTILDEAEKSLSNGELLAAYKKAYAARQCLLGIQKGLARKKR